MRGKRIRVKLRRLRSAALDLWSDSIDPLDRLVTRAVLRVELQPAAQLRLLRVWFALR